MAGRLCVPCHIGRPFDELEQRGYDQFEMCFESEIIDEVYSELKASGVEFVHEMVEQPWHRGFSGYTILTGMLWRSVSP